MHELAEELNSILRQQFPLIWSGFSELGKRIYFPKGILAQSQEANTQSKDFNATIGIATLKQIPFFLSDVQSELKNFQPQDIYTYAPIQGRKKLRALWKKNILIKNPSLDEKLISSPILTCGITHGINLAAKIFVDKDDLVIIPSLNWENYGLIFETENNAKIVHYPLFADKEFNISGFENSLNEAFLKKDKVVTVLNFPNNPTGYSLSEEEQDQIVEVCRRVVPSDKLLVVICDDAYFGLFFDSTCAKQSIFAKLTNSGSNILAIKLDGATKEYFMWGFRIGFMTFGYSEKNVDLLYNVLEKKAIGLIRTNISSPSHPVQTILEKLLEKATYYSDAKSHFQKLKQRALLVKSLLEKNTAYGKYFEYYPFNSGYFMCLKLKNILAENLRKKLLDEYQIGTIAFNSYDLRIAFSSIDEEKIEHLFSCIYKACSELSD